MYILPSAKTYRLLPKGERKMTVVVVGGSGATGRHVVRQLLEKGIGVRAIVRNGARARALFPDHKDLSLIVGNVLEMTGTQIAECTAGCDAVCSCLGHNNTLRGLFGKPRRLVTDTTRLLCDAISQGTRETAARYVLMNTAGVRSKRLKESATVPEKVLAALLRALLPPSRDNELAAAYLADTVGTGNKKIEWVIGRPDSLHDAESCSECELFPSPTRSPVFNAGKTSRVNVGHFMASLAQDRALWDSWRFQMPVIYDVDRAYSPGNLLPD
jgi:hypothetical protein